MLLLLIAMICIVRLRECRIDGRVRVTVGNGTIDKVSKWGGRNGSDRAGAFTLVGVWGWVFQEGAKRSEVPSKDLVIIFDRTDVHHVTGVIFNARRSGPVCLWRDESAMKNMDAKRREGGEAGYHIS